MVKWDGSSKVCKWQRLFMKLMKLCFRGGLHLFREGSTSRAKVPIMCGLGEKVMKPPTLQSGWQIG